MCASALDNVHLQPDRERIAEIFHLRSSRRKGDGTSGREKAVR